MAIDTAAKRHSALAQRWMRLPFGRRFSQPLPDGTIDQGDRQHAGFAYSGILAGAAVQALPFHNPVHGTAVARHPKHGTAVARHPRHASAVRT